MIGWREPVRVASADVPVAPDVPVVSDRQRQDGATVSQAEKLARLSGRVDDLEAGRSRLVEQVAGLQGALQDCKRIAAAATVEEPVFVLPNKIAARVDAALASVSVSEPSPEPEPSTAGATADAVASGKGYYQATIDFVAPDATAAATFAALYESFHRDAANLEGGGLERIGDHWPLDQPMPQGVASVTDTRTALTDAELEARGRTLAERIAPGESFTVEQYQALGNIETHPAPAATVERLRQRVLSGEWAAPVAPGELEKLREALREREQEAYNNERVAAFSGDVARTHSQHGKAVAFREAIELLDAAREALRAASPGPARSCLQFAPHPPHGVCPGVPASTEEPT